MLLTKTTHQPQYIRRALRKNRHPPVRFFRLIADSSNSSKISKTFFPGAWVSQAVTIPSKCTLCFFAGYSACKSKVCEGGEEEDTRGGEGREGNHAIMAEGGGAARRGEPSSFLPSSPLPPSALLLLWSFPFSPGTTKLPFSFLRVHISPTSWCITKT